jgi:hypothetical protein
MASVGVSRTWLSQNRRSNLPELFPVFEQAQLPVNAMGWLLAGLLFLAVLATLFMEWIRRG